MTGLASIDLGIIGPALAAGLLVLATHVPLGLRVLRRGIVFIDLAIAQVAGLGAIAASLWGADEGHPLLTQAAALGAALVGALLLTWTERRWPQLQEALIGTLFVLAASLAALLLANHPHGGEHLKDLMVGQILWVSRGQLWTVALVTGALGVLWMMLRSRPGQLGFYLAFAISVTASVQLVGVYLVFASLIVPALAVLRLTRYQAAAGFGLGAAGYASGLLLSMATDLPAGPLIVCTLALLALMSALPAVGRGLRR
jgi:zinc/manganese transport system permease protein